MIRTLLVLALTLTACGAHSASRPNFAAVTVAALDPGAKCLPFYRDTGEHHTHSAMCLLSDRRVVYYVIRDDAGPANQLLLGETPKPDAAKAPGPASPPPDPPAAEQPKPEAPKVDARQPAKAKGK